MSGLQRVLVWGLSDKNVEWARQGVGELAKVKIAGDDLATHLEGSGSQAGNIVLIGMDQGIDAALPTMALCRSKNAPVVAVGVGKDADVILKAMRAGAMEYVVSGDDADLHRALRRLSTAFAPHATCSISAIYPAKGGVGATAIAANLAGACQRAGERVCLVDLGRYFGDVLAFLDLPSEYSINDVLANMRRLDRDLLDSSVPHHSSGIAVLAQSDKVDDAAQVRPADVETLFRFLRQHYDRIIVDGLRGFDDMALAALDGADDILLVLTQDVPSVRDTQRTLEIFKRLGYPDTKVKLLLNRVQPRSKIDSAVVEQVTGAPVAAMVAADFPLLIDTINRGVMVYQTMPRSRIAKDFEKLAQLIRGDKVIPQQRTGIFGGFFASRGESAHGTE